MLELHYVVIITDKTAVTSTIFDSRNAAETFMFNTLRARPYSLGRIEYTYRDSATEIKTDLNASNTTDLHLDQQGY